MILCSTPAPRIRVEAACQRPRAERRPQSQSTPPWHIFDRLPMCPIEPWRRLRGRPRQPRSLSGTRRGQQAEQRRGGGSTNSGRLARSPLRRRSLKRSRRTSASFDFGLGGVQCMPREARAGWPATSMAGLRHSYCPWIDRLTARGPGLEARPAIIDPQGRRPLGLLQEFNRRSTIAHITYSACLPPNPNPPQTGDRMAAVGVMSALGLPDVGAGATTGAFGLNGGSID